MLYLYQDNLIPNSVFSLLSTIKNNLIEDFINKIIDEKTIITSSQASMRANEQVETTGPGVEEFFLAATEIHVVRVNLNPDDVLHINWYAEERTLTGGESSFDVYEITGKLGVTMVVKDPLGEVIYLGEEVDKQTVDITADMSGTHTMTFVNTLTFQGQTILLDYIANP